MLGVGKGYGDNNELMQMVYLRFPVPKRMPMCATSSNHWELAIVIGAGEGSVCGITARSLITVVYIRMYIAAES